MMSAISTARRGNDHALFDQTEGGGGLPMGYPLELR
jgi:hypothetical protein